MRNIRELQRTPGKPAATIGSQGRSRLFWHSRMDQGLIGDFLFAIPSAYVLHMCAATHRWMGRPEDNTGCLSLLLPTVLFEIGSLTGLDFIDSARLADQQALGILLSPLPSTSITSMHHHTWPLYVGAGDRIWTQVITLARQAHHQCSHLPRPFLILVSGFWEGNCRYAYPTFLYLHKA